MFERMSDDTRAVVVQAQEHARRLGHSSINCGHLLLAVASTSEAASAVLRDAGVTPRQVEAQIIRLGGAAQLARRPGDLDREALAAIGIDLDAVRTRIEATFGPGALGRCAPRARRRRPVRGKGPLAEIMRRRSRSRPRRRSRHDDQRAATVSLPLTGHLPFTARAKSVLEGSVREAQALPSGSGSVGVGVEHLALAIIATNSGMVPPILAALDASAAVLRAGILDRYRQAS